MDTGLPFVVIQHLDAKHESLLPELLAKATHRPVREVTNGMLVEPNVMPANTGLALSQQAFELTVQETSAAMRMPIDGFFGAPLVMPPTPAGRTSGAPPTS